MNGWISLGSLYSWVRTEAFHILRPQRRSRCCPISPTYCTHFIFNCSRFLTPHRNNKQRKKDAPRCWLVIVGRFFRQRINFCFETCDEFEMVWIDAECRSSIWRFMVGWSDDFEKKIWGPFGFWLSRFVTFSISSKNSTEKFTTREWVSDGLPFASQSFDSKQSIKLVNRTELCCLSSEQSNHSLEFRHICTLLRAKRSSRQTCISIAFEMRKKEEKKNLKHKRLQLKTAKTVHFTWDFIHLIACDFHKSSPLRATKGHTSCVAEFQCNWRANNCRRSLRLLFCLSLASCCRFSGTRKSDWAENKNSASSCLSFSSDDWKCFVFVENRLWQR